MTDEEDLKAMVECEPGDIQALIDRHCELLTWWANQAASSRDRAFKGAADEYAKIEELMSVLADFTTPPSTAECEPGDSDVPF